MPDYDLSRLSSRSFEQLIQSLAIKVLGPGIVVFGDGPDGGREAIFERKLDYPTPRNLAGNPDSPQAVIFLTSITDVMMGS